MQYKSFTSKSETVHKKFLCKEFFMDFHDYGIDFLVDNFAIEMKCKKRYRKTITFVCNKNQIDEWEENYKGKKLYWLFLLYDLSCKVSTIRSQSGIESRILNREVWFMPWNFVKKFKLHEYTWGPHIHFTNKNFPAKLHTTFINGVNYHYIPGSEIEHIFLRREFLL